MLGDKLKTGGTGTTLVSRDTELIGDIKFSGTFDLEGIVRGSIRANPGTDALVRIIDKGLVEGDVHAPHVVINGAVVGSVYASEHLELASKARVEGNVHYKLVEMAIGAQVNGSLEHIPEGADVAGLGDSTSPASKDTIDHDQIPRLATAPSDVGTGEPGIAAANPRAEAAE